MPHLSLAYVDDVSLRDRVAHEFDGRVPATIDFETLAVAMPRSGDWKTKLRQRPGDPGDHEEWVVIYSRPLGRPGNAKPAPLSIILVGGQLGVDQAAYRAAQKVGLLAVGWLPPDRETDKEKGTPPIPEDILLWEVPSRNSPRTPDIAPSARTALNVRDVMP